MELFGETRVRLLLCLLAGILVICGSSVSTPALTPLTEEEMSAVSGRDGADISFRLLLNDGTGEDAGGSIFIGGGAGSILHNSGNEGYLAIGDISSDFTWSVLHTDVITKDSGKSVISIRMDDADDVSGTLHLDQIGVTKSSSLSSSNIPANLMGDVTLDGTFNIDGRMEIFPN